MWEQFVEDWDNAKADCTEGKRMNSMYEKLHEHFGHHIEIIQYGNDDSPIEFAIECEDCCCVLVSSEDYED